MPQTQLRKVISDSWVGLLPSPHLCAHAHMSESLCLSSCQHARALSVALCIINILYTFVCVYIAKMVCMT